MMTVPQRRFLVVAMPSILLRFLLCCLTSRQSSVVVVDGFSLPSGRTPTSTSSSPESSILSISSFSSSSSSSSSLQISAASSQEPDSSSDQDTPSQQQSSSFLSSVMGGGGDINSDDDNNNKNSNNQQDNNNNNQQQYDDSIRRGLRRLAQLSLEDYAWRMSLFKENQADRQMEESMARLMGEDALYVRPMDAGENKIGPLGRAEKAAVDWLSQVIDEEGRRAKKIVNTDGELVRPIDMGEELGPLGTLEMKVVEFLQSIRTAEKLRVKDGGFWRPPKDLDESNRGPLGQLELSVTSALQKIQESEMLRMEQQKRRGGEVVRPIDVPGPLGEFELAVAEMIQTERLRARDGREKTDNGIVRPKDAAVKGKLGEYEDQAVEALSRLTEEERERLRSIQQKLKDNQPMAAEEPSFLGILESILVGILRAPALLFGVIARVMELLQSESLNAKDQALLDSQTRGKDNKKD